MPKSIFRKRAFSFVIAVILSVFPVISCSSDNGGNKDNSIPNVDGDRTSGENSAIGEITTENLMEKYQDGLGEYNFNGEKFKIHTMNTGGVHYLADAEEETGDVLNDAIYRRNRVIEERFNVVINQVLMDDNFAQPRKIMVSGDSSAFDILHARAPDALTFWQDGLVYSCGDIPNIDFSKPYWSQYANKSLTLKGSQYIALGEFNISAFDLAHVLIFNKNMIQDHSLENPYSLVKEGKWTFDKMDEFMRQVITDLDGNGIMDKNDKYGFLSEEREVLPCFWISSGEFSVKKDETDTPYLAIGEERFLSVFNKVFEITWDNGAYFSAKDHTSTLPQSIRDMFSNGQSLFMNMTFFYMESMRTTETDFGVLPYPKFDDNQENYFTRVEYYNAVQVPLTNSDTERAGVMLEALNSYSAKYVLPAYYDISLKTKYSRDEESAEMLDLILSIRVIDIGDTTLCDKIRDNFMWSMFENNKRDLVSQVEKTQGVIQKFIDKIPQD